LKKPIVKSTTHFRVKSPNHKIHSYFLYSTAKIGNGAQRVCTGLVAMFKYLSL